MEVTGEKGEKGVLAGEPAAAHQRPYPAKLFVEATTRCNLGCFMCVKQTAGCAMSEGDLAPETFARLEPALPHLDALVLNGVGEPLLNPRLEEYLARAKRLLRPGAWTGFQTNGLLLTESRAHSLVAAGLDKVCLSVDAASAETFRKVREGGELDLLYRAFAALESAKKGCGRPDLQVGVEFVAMRSNLSELPAALRWAADRGASFAIVTHLLPYEEGHAAEAAYHTVTDEALALFGKYRELARQKGLDLERYAEARWRYTRTSRERELVALVDALKAEARERGLFLDLKKLVQTETGKLDQVSEAFEKAREVAREKGLELRLPEVTLREERSCRFVEEGGAFVSWDGNISPCYFLWHRYLSFASGWEQQVKPKVFGNLAERGILEIWNSDPFARFRASVVGYDYPNCASCGLAPCDYVQNDGFEQDCHIREVPCGACLWCAGVFQCLS